MILSAGRLVWEKGHQDVIRASGSASGGIVDFPAAVTPRLIVVGSGPEKQRLRQHAAEPGVGDRVDFRSVPYEDMLDLYAQASCMLLASLATVGYSRYRGDLPRCFWEEQFGMVLAEAMAAGLPIVASASGAIRKVVGDVASYFTAGDLARAGPAPRRGGPLSVPPAQRVKYDRQVVTRFSTAAASERLAAAY